MEDMQPADNFRDAYNRMEVPLSTPEVFEAYHVTRAPATVDAIVDTLALTDGCARILYSGYNMSGKTTELFNVMRGLEERFTPVYFSADDAFDRLDLDYRDVLFGMCVALAAKAQEAGVSVDGDVHRRLRDWAPQMEKEIERLTTVEKGYEFSTGAGFKAFIADFFGKYRQERVTRDEIREELAPRGEEILSTLELLTSAFRGEDVPAPVLIVDDLEKTDLDTAASIFIDHAENLLDAPCDVIYTIPIGLVDADHMQTVRNRFDETFLLPMIAVRDRNGEPQENQVARINQMIARRAAPSLFEDDVLDYISLSSGGIIADALRMARNVCREAWGNEAPSATLEMAEAEFTNLVRSRARGTERKYYDRLAEVAVEHVSPVDEEHRRLMHAAAILQYENDPYWYDVHPAIRKLLESRALI